MHCLGPHLNRFVGQHHFHLGQDFQVAGIVQQVQSALANGRREMSEQTAEHGVVAGLAPHLKQAQPVQDLLLVALFQCQRQHPGRGGVQYAGSGAFRIQGVTLDGPPQHVQVFLPDTVRDADPARQEDKVNHADAAGTEVQQVGENPQHQARCPVGDPVHKNVEKRLDLALDVGRHGQVEQFGAGAIQGVE